MLDNLTASSACSDGRSPLTERFCGGVHALSWRFLYKLSKLSCGFCCCCCFFFFPSFPLSFFFSVVTSNYFFLVWVEIVGVHVDWDVIRSTTTRRVDTVSALPQQGLGSLRHGQESWIFRCSQFSSPAEIGWTTPRPAWCPWKKNLSLRDVSKPEVPYTYQPANLHRANARIERKISWWVLVASHCFRSSYLSLSFVIHGRVSLWHAVGWFQRHFSIPQRCSSTNTWQPSTSQSPQELAVHRSLLFVQPGATQFLRYLEM